jgi:toxin-antitoxin system PIN domain toxin
MISFPDVNVWIALAIAEHVHHKAAQAWLDSSQGPVIFCRVTQMGLLRILTNRHALGSDTLSAALAWGAFDAFLRNNRISMSEEPSELEHHWRLATNHERPGSNWWTDAYLAAFASAAGFTLVTFDAQLARRKDARTHLLRQ